MSTVFPVELEILNSAAAKNSTGSTPLTTSGMLQGFTRDVSAGGMCVELKAFNRQTEELLQSAGAKLALVINPAFSVHPIRATGRIAWLRKETTSGARRYLIGVAYLEIDERAKSRLVGYARRLRWTPRFVAAGGVALSMALAFLLLSNQRLIEQNEALVHRLVEAAEKKTGAVSKIYTEDLKEVMRQMVDWLKSHQNLHTGLVASYEGDAALEDTAFTYDQSLACQTFLLFGEIRSAQTLLSFYGTRAASDDSGGFYNAYYTLNGQPAEHVVQTGPNIWMGIAALQCYHRTQKDDALSLAKRIGEWTLRQQDAEGGLRGGPRFSWYSTEHNLDAYAFFSMLYHQTRDEKYRDARDKVLGWIKKYAYSNKERRIFRGKGDATIATDTFSWAVAAIGPPTLKKIGFDPEGIMAYAEEHCEVTVPYRQPNGKTGAARGFDFAKARNLGRGGVISTEWTAQVIVTYQILADYFRSLGDSEKAAAYLEKSYFYLNELQKLVITSPSRTGQGRGCLPYASTDSVDTGHGWRTPAGPRTGSVAGTAYGIFAWAGHNPFNLSDAEEKR